MTPNNNYSILPFYKSLNEQSPKNFYAYGRAFNLATPNDMLPTFQINREHRSNLITSVILVDYITGQQVNITGNAISYGGLEIKYLNDYDIDVIICRGWYLGLNNPNGQYYLIISDGIETWYSDIFNWCNASKMVCLEWFDGDSFYFEDDQIMFYDGNFSNRLYLCADIRRPEYEFTDEAETLDGYFYPIKQIAEKIFRFVFGAPEYLCDCLRLVRLSDNVYIHDREFSRTYRSDEILITPSWGTVADIANIEVEFHCQAIAKKINSTASPLPPPVIPDPPTPGEKGDFNNDFNNDFFVEN
ncbi:MAG: hypothetical protein LBP67_04980 [Bacteroidales bacterium]|jgi:hypothetical protein|nr:hypothetical protein [Bacteroidales bacterium]